MARTKIYDAVDYVDSGRAEGYGDRHLPTEWTQIEAAIAFELDHPILVFREERVHPAGLLDPSQGGLAVWTFSLGASGTEDLQTIVRRLPDFRRKVEMFARRRGR